MLHHHCRHYNHHRRRRRLHWHWRFHRRFGGDARGAVSQRGAVRELHEPKAPRVLAGAELVCGLDARGEGSEPERQAAHPRRLYSARHSYARAPVWTCRSWLPRTSEGATRRHRLARPRRGYSPQGPGCVRVLLVLWRHGHDGGASVPRHGRAHGFEPAEPHGLFVVGGQRRVRRRARLQRIRMDAQARRRSRHGSKLPLPQRRRVLPLRLFGGGGGDHGVRQHHGRGGRPERRARWGGPSFGLHRREPQQLLLLRWRAVRRPGLQERDGRP
mmetsp:Transcript_47297/g.93727  ORF Transcript_47297/g.93727 Transcript_47297/m.93727 type:complete len:272 (+) Transcript_47297:434-1249(+)